MNQDKDYNLYLLAELTYKSEHKDIEEDILFPTNWYSINNYKLKIEIIDEALEKNIYIKDTKSYQKLLEGNK